MSSGQQAAKPKKVYMLYNRDGGLEGGPYLGESDLDFSALSAKFQMERYAKAEAAKEDYCAVFECDFVAWLVGQGIVVPMETIAITVTLDTQGETRYIPTHWPLCPECGVGRGEETMGRVLHALNRCDWHRKCTECGHDWDHQDHPCRHDQPMLEDDGRCIANSCVPYSISQAGALPIADVLSVCAKHGWSESGGMYDSHGIQAAGELGVRMLPRQVAGIQGRPTLRKLLTTLHPAKNYIVATKEHWLAVVNGENRDPANTSMRTEVFAYWEVQPANSQGV